MRKSRTSLRDLLLPAAATRPDSGARTRAVAGSLAKNISSPFLVSSTNAALDPYYLEPQPLYQPDSPVKAPKDQTCFSGAKPSYASDHAQQGPPSVTLVTEKPHVPILSAEHSWPLIFPSDVGDLQDVPDLESAHSSDSTESDLLPETPPPVTIPRIAFEGFPDDDSTTFVKKTYEFKIDTVGASVRQGDFLKVPNGSRVSSSLLLRSPQGARRLRVQVFYDANHSDVFPNSDHRLPAVGTALEGIPESRIEDEDETENQIADIRLSQQSEPDLSCGNGDRRNTSARRDGLMMQPPRVYPALELSDVVHFRGKHCRSRAASYHVTTKTLTERGDIYVRPFPGGPNSSRWSPKNGMMIVKVYIPSTDDIWAAYFPTNVTIPMFTLRWLSKLNLRLRFSGSTMDTPEYYFNDTEFQRWIKHRVRHGRNLPIVGHLDYAVPPPCLLPNHF